MAYLRLFWHRHLAYLQRGSLTFRSRQPVATLISLAHTHVAMNGRCARVWVYVGWHVNRFGGGALHYFHRFISRETRWGKGGGREKERAEVGRGEGVGPRRLGGTGRRYVIRSPQTLMSMSKEREDWFRFDLRNSPSCRTQLRGRGRFPAYKDAYQMQWWLICGLYQTRFDLTVVVALTSSSFARVCYPATEDLTCRFE